jgi:hypothetical protein
VRKKGLSSRCFLKKYLFAGTEASKKNSTPVGRRGSVEAAVDVVQGRFLDDRHQP